MADARNSGKKTFLSGVLLLSGSTVLVKIVGLIYKIPMLSYLGSEGMGYFNSAYEIYALFCVIATAGLPVALSVLISGALAKREYRSADRIFRASMTVFLLIGIFGTGIMAVLAPAFCRMIRSESAYLCILSISPTVFFVCVSSALRGYFQGHQKMLQTAVSQLLEAIGKLAFGLLLARWALEQGYDTPHVAAAAGIGLSVGTLLSMLYLIAEKVRFRPSEREMPALQPLNIKYRSIWKSLARLAIPMTLGASAVSLTKLIDMAMILRRLQAIGYTEALANEAYGGYTTLALSVYGLLPSLVNSIALPLVPMLSAAIASGDRERQSQMIRSSYHLTAVFALPAALGVAAYARPILLLLFPGAPEAVVASAPLLSMLGVSVFLSCMITATGSVLHAYQVVNRPILSLLSGATVKIAVAYILIGNPRIGLLGAPISTFLCNATVVMINLVLVSRLCKVPEAGKIFQKPLLASACSVGISYGIYLILTAQLGESSLISVGSLLLTAVLYFLFSCWFGVFRAEDLVALPMGERICGIMERLHLLRTEKES